MKVHSEDIKTLELDIEGPAVVTAGDLIHDSEVEIKNPDVYILLLRNSATCPSRPNQ